MQQSSLAWPRCPYHGVNLEVARAFDLPVFICSQCLSEHLNGQTTKPLALFQIRPGLLSRYHHEMAEQKQRAQQQGIDTSVLPDFPPDQMERLVEDLANVETSRIPSSRRRRLHRRLRPDWFRWLRRRS